MVMSVCDALAAAKRMRVPTILFRDIGADGEAWAVFLIDGPEDRGERIDLRDSCASRLDEAFKWFYDNEWPLHGMPIRVEHHLCDTRL